MPIFLAPLFLAGALLAAAPVVMHLLHRRKPRPVSFSTIRFLRAAVARTRRSRRVTQILTLLMRVLILLLLALAFARPKLRYAQWLPQGSRTIVILLDSSASMHARHGDDRVYDIARDWALNLMETLEPGDRAAVWGAGLADPAVVFPPVSDHPAVAGALKGCQPAYQAVDLVTALREVLERLEFGVGRTGVEVHLFSDFQSSAWDSVRAEDLNQVLAGKDVTLFLNHVRPAVIPNAGLAKVQFSPPAIIGAGNLLTKSSVRASSDYAGENSLQLTLDGVDVATRTFTIGSGGQTSVTVPAPVAADSGDGVTGVLTLGDDPYPLDNRFYFSLPRISGVPVLLVEGGGNSGQRRDTFFLHSAIKPGSRSNIILAPETMDWTQFLGADLDSYKILLISNPPTLQGAAAAKIESFANGGGHVTVFPGVAGDAGLDIPGLAPFDGLSVTLKEEPEPATETLLASSPKTPMEQKAMNVLPAPFEVVLRKRLVFSDLPPAVQSYFHYGDQSPFLILAEHGNGSIAMASVSATRDWSEWPLTPFYVITLQELMKRAVNRNLDPLTTTVGSVFALKWTEPELALDFSLTAPDGATEVITLTRSSVTNPLLIKQLSQPGFYRLSRGAQARTIAVNPPPQEGILEYINQGRLANDLRSASLLQTSSWEEQRPILGTVRHGRPLWPLLLIFAFLIALAEEVFANYQSRTVELPPGLRRLLAGGKA